LTSRFGSPTSPSPASSSTAATAAPPPKPPKSPRRSKPEKLSLDTFLGTTLKKDGLAVVSIRGESHKSKSKRLRITGDGELVLESTSGSLLKGLMPAKKKSVAEQTIVYELKGVIEGEKAKHAFFLEFSNGAILHLGAASVEECEQLMDAFTNLLQQVKCNVMHVALLISDSAHDPISTDPAAVAVAKETVKEIYRRVNLSKLRELDAIFEQWAEREEQLLARVRSIYGEELLKLQAKEEVAAASAASSGSAFGWFAPKPKPKPAVPRPAVASLADLPVKQLKQLAEDCGLKGCIEKSDFVQALDQYYAEFA